MKSELPDEWRKPPEKPMPPLPQDRPAHGNRTVLVLVDSRRPEFTDVAATTIAALHHWGVPYQIHDGQLSNAVIRDHAAILIGQEHYGQSLNKQAAQAVLDAVSSGTGLCVLDASLEEYPSELRDALRLRPGSPCESDVLQIRGNEHFVTALRDEHESIPLRKAVALSTLAGSGHDLLFDRDGQSVLHASRHGRGRVIWWGVSPKVWLPETLGHAWGLDDLMWRSLAWVALKPFVMKAMPPFVSMRFDDSGGLAGLHWMIGYATSSSSATKTFPAQVRRILDLKPNGAASVLSKFEYVRILNRFGWRPEVSLFVDQVLESDWGALREIFDDGGVQVSCHALSDGFDAQGHWRSHFLTHQGIEVQTPSGRRVVHCISPDSFSEAGGPFIHSIPRDVTIDSMPRYRIASWPDGLLEEHFRHVDAIWEKRAIQPGRTTNIHWRNPPSNALLPLKDRGQTFSMWTSRYNYATVDPDAYAWRMLPYGDAGMCLDYMPIPTDAETIALTDFFNAQAHVFLRSLMYDAIASDVDFFRCKKPPLPGLLTHHDLSLVAESIAHQAKLGLQSLFFACPLTHEMNLATLTAEEWRDVMADVERRLRRYPKQFILYDTIAATARAKCETHLSTVETDGDALNVEIEGHADVDVHLHVFHDEGEDGCVGTSLNVPRFFGKTRRRIT